MERKAREDCREALIEDKYARWSDLRFQYGYLETVSEAQYDKMKKDLAAQGITPSGFFTGSYSEGREAARQYFHQLQVNIEFEQHEVLLTSGLSATSAGAYKECLDRQSPKIVHFVKVDRSRVELHVKWQSRLGARLRRWGVTLGGTNLKPKAHPPHTNLNNMPLLPENSADWTVYLFERTDSNVADFTIWADMSTGRFTQGVSIPWVPDVQKVEVEFHGRTKSSEPINYGEGHGGQPAIHDVVRPIDQGYRLKKDSISAVVSGANSVSQGWQVDEFKPEIAKVSAWCRNPYPTMGGDVHAVWTWAEIYDVEYRDGVLTPRPPTEVIVKLKEMGYPTDKPIFRTSEWSLDLLAAEGLVDVQVNGRRARGALKDARGVTLYFLDISGHVGPDDLEKFWACGDRSLAGPFITASDVIDFRDDFAPSCKKIIHVDNTVEGVCQGPVWQKKYGEWVEVRDQPKTMARGDDGSRLNVLAGANQISQAGDDNPA